VKVKELIMMEKNGLLPISMEEVKMIRKGEVPERLAKEPWELNLRKAEEMLAELFGYNDVSEDPESVV